MRRALVFLAAARLAAQQTQTAIVDVNVIDVARGEVRAGQTVVVAGGRIEAIGPAAQVAIPSGAARVAGAGRYVMPGLWDMHVHLRSDQKNPAVRLVAENEAMLDLFLPNGVVGIREMGGDLADEVIRWRDEVAAGKRQGPRILTAGRKIDSEPPAWAGSLGVKTAEGARQAVRQLKQSGADFVKVYFNDVPPEVLAAVIAEAHQSGLKVTGHMPVNIGIRRFVETGIDGMEHSQYFPAAEPEEYSRYARERETRRGKKWAMDGAESAARLLGMQDAKETEAVLRLMAAKHFWVTPTLTVYAHSVENGSRDYDSDARRRYFFPAIWSTWDAKAGFRRPYTGRTLELRTEGLRRWREATAAAARAGVPMLMGTDSGANNEHTMPGWSVHEELEELVGAGLTPAEALRMATINAAEWRGAAATEGSVERGKVADLVLLRSNPLEAIRHTREIEAVVQGGRYYSRADLDSELKRAETAASLSRH